MQLTHHPPRASRARWLAAAGLVIGNLLLHKPISDVCDALFARIGRRAYEWVAVLAIGALSLAGAGALARGRAARLVHPAPLAALALLTLLSVAAQRWLLVSNIELVHLPQFALLAALLLGVGVGPLPAWLLATLAGVLDEAYQRIVIYAAVPNVYFDWNDIVLNALGAAWAVVLLRGGAPHDPPAPAHGASRRALVAGLPLAAALVALWLVPPAGRIGAPFPWLHPTTHRALTGFDYHVMPVSEGVAALALLWALIVLVTPAPRRRAPAALAVAALLGLAAGALPGCAAPPPRPLPPPAPPRPFFITMWCGPPLAALTDARAAEIAAAGFDIIGAPCEGKVSEALNRRALDIAERHGLRMWITDPRVDLYGGVPADWEARLAAAVAAYGDHPALDGYFLIDEPLGDRLAAIAPVVDRLRALDPARLPYVNMLPPYVSPEALDAASYGEHIDRYLAALRPPLLSVSYYPFRRGSDRPGTFATLALVRERARRAGVPWLLIVQALPHGRYRDPTPAELAWQVMHGLAYGARGISYFTYWTPVHVYRARDWQFRRGLVEHGVATPKLAAVAALNRDARAIATTLDGYDSTAVLDSAMPPAAWPAPLAALTGDRVTAGFFAAPDGAAAALLVNRSYREPAAIDVELRAGGLAWRLDAARDVLVWLPGRRAALTLPPGGAVLVGTGRPAAAMGSRG